MNNNHQNHKRRPNSGSIKTAGNTIISRKSETKNTILVKDTANHQQGNGLWCINTEKNINSNLSKENSEKQKNETKMNLNTEIANEFDKKIIDNLKFKNKDLTEKLLNALTKAAEMEYKSQRLENKMKDYLDICEEKVEENKEIKEKLESLENNIIHLNEALSNARKEINRLQIELNNESEKAKSVLEMHQSLLLEKDRREAMVNSEVNNLLIHIQGLVSDKDNLLKLMKNQDKKNEYANNIQKLIDEKEITSKNNEIQINKILAENADLKRRILNEENNKIKLNEIIKKKKEKINLLKDQLKSYKDAVVSSRNETKWNSEMVAQRDNQLKILKEKLINKESEIQKLNKALDNFKKRKQGNTNPNAEDNDVIEMQKIIPKPFLFGPETNDKDF